MLRAQYRREVAGHADVRSGIDTVRCQADLEHDVVGHPEVFAYALAHRRIGGQHEDARMRGAHPDLVLRADHPFGHFSADLGFLNLERLARERIHGGTHDRDDHFLSGRHVGRAADDGQGRFAADVHRRQAQLVGVGMPDAGLHLAHHQAAQAALDRFHGFDALDFEPAKGQVTGNGIGG